MVCLAIFFSWGGDTLLLFKNFFIFGLLSFLLCHICYIAIYIYETKEKEVRKRLTLRQEILITIPYLIFAIAILGFLYPHLGKMVIPVFVYGTILITMARLTWLRYSKTTSMSFKMVMIGAIIFVSSDLSIAIRKFVIQGNYWGAIIIITYIVGQYLIIHGFIYGNRRNDDDEEYENKENNSPNNL